MNRMFDEFSSRVDFLAVYILEAHAQDEWCMGSQKCLYNQPISLDDRKRVARDFIRDMNFKIKLMIDLINNNFDEEYFAWPERFWVIHKGRITFMAEVGPFGFRLDLLQEYLANNFAN